MPRSRSRRGTGPDPVAHGVGRGCRTGGHGSGVSLGQDDLAPVPKTVCGRHGNQVRAGRGHYCCVRFHPVTGRAFLGATAPQPGSAAPRAVPRRVERRLGVVASQLARVPCRVATCTSASFGSRRWRSFTSSGLLPRSCAGRSFLPAVTRTGKTTLQSSSPRRR